MKEMGLAEDNGMVASEGGAAKRCGWCNLDNALYVKYHDEEWGVMNTDDRYLFEMLVLESFQAGLSWECVLNKRADFREAYGDFEVNRVADFGEKKVEELLTNGKIIRNRLKINASINNAKIFKNIQEEYGSFYNYLLIFTDGKILYEVDRVNNDWSDDISKDLRGRGMKFVGSTIMYAYLQATGFIYAHEKGCFMHKSCAMV